MKTTRVSSSASSSSISPVVNFTTKILCTTFTLVSMFSMVLCFENDAGDHHQRLGTQLKENSDHSLWPPINDRLALKELYEVYKDVDPIWKRAPSASGFYGVRGKKAPGQSFFGMRGKKGPSGFLGMRGKKMDEGRLYGLDDLAAAAGGFEGDTDSLDSALGDLWNTRESLLSSKTQQQQFGDNLLDDRSEIKRAPSSGFMGLRGKRNLSSKQKPLVQQH